MSNMMRAGVLLSLTDKYTPGLARAQGATGQFAASASSGFRRLGGAARGALGSLAAFAGISLGAGAAVKGVIDMEDRLVRLGIQSGHTSEEMMALKKSIFDVVRQKDISISPDRLADAVDQIVEKTGDMEFAKKNLEGMATAIQATGASGADIGGLYAEFQKMGLSKEDAFQALDILNVQGKNGAFTLQNLAKLGPRVINAYTASGRSGVDAAREMGAVLQVIRQGTGSSEQASTAFEALMRTFFDPAKAKKIEKMGVSLKDSSGGFRSVADIFTDIVQMSEGDLEILGGLFDAEGQRAFNAAAAELKRTGYLETLDKLLNVTADGSQTLEDSATASRTMKSALTNLKTSWQVFADTNLAAPVAKLAEALNNLEPEKLQKVYGTVKDVALVGGGLMVAGKALQIGANVSTLFGGRRKGAGTPILSGGAGVQPVFITNWNGAAGLLNAKGAGAPFAAKKVAEKILPAASVLGHKILPAAGVALGATEGVAGILQKDAEKAGRGFGGAAGTLAGLKAGAALGATVGSVVPGLGTALGAAVGAALGSAAGYFGGRLVGEQVAKDIEAGRSTGPYVRMQDRPPTPKVEVSVSVHSEDRHVSIQPENVASSGDVVSLIDTGNIMAALR